ncbi:sodium:solute symporter [Thalassotalea atypica]|uniref:sodium:solute symporter n=1 Tax=Thalassotalea atypica TaxID=2054316 RepID=UPI002574320C|nr:sodium:solute symporter [Thalassotalea atypica]
MIRKLYKSTIVLLLMMPLISVAEVLINWQEITPNVVNEIKVGHGAYINEQNNNLLISSGLKSNTPPYVAEQLIGTTAPAKSMLVVHGQQLFEHDLAETLGNRAFAATTSFYGSTVVIGGIANNTASNLVNIVTWQAESQTLNSYALPSLPRAAMSPSSVIIKDTLYVLTGSDAKNNFYSIDLSSLVDSKNELIHDNNLVEQFNINVSWNTLPSLPLASNTFPYQNGVKLAVQNDGSGNKIFAIGGYLLPNAANSYQDDLIAIDGYWKFDPALESSLQKWQPFSGIINAKENNIAKINSVSTLGQSHILAFTDQGNTLSYNAITKSWTEYSATQPKNSVDTKNYLISESVSSTNGDIFSLNRTVDDQGSLKLYQMKAVLPAKDFGWVNMTVLIVYLLSMVLVGLFFVFKNKNTDDYFRGGQTIPWWAAACSIYATMLSSLTYVALPAVVYQTNWLLLIGIWMIIAVAPIAIYVVMPFFRQIDATSAYEYLSKRFNMGVRLFASGLFTLFHISRMGIVMAVTALALSAVTPLSASESVLIMGVLCLLYCTMGGIEAVIWTDTIQTVVLLVGAIVCFVVIILGLDNGLNDFITIGFQDDKFTMVNVDFSASSITSLSIWVIILGGIGQNLSSYTSDQSVVQRYMVTKDPAAASKSIWANAGLAAPGALLFFCLGTGLYVFYQLNPGKLDPTIQIDQIFPTFIATELPIGLAGLIVAGIFAAAQSTVSTSMNSIATTVVTDFVRPFNLVKTEKGYMNAARWLTFIMGVLGTLAGLIFINPEIRSLMSAYFKVIGMFMGALGGLFILGALTKKANAFGALVGIFSGVATMVSAWLMGWANGYIFGTIGIVSCLIFGYLGSFLAPSLKKDLTGLTLYTMQSPANESS